MKTSHTESIKQGSEVQIRVGQVERREDRAGLESRHLAEDASAAWAHCGASEGQ